MKPEFPQDTQEEIQVTALLLGELKPQEEATLREKIARDPALAQLHERLKATMEFVRLAAADSPKPAAGSSSSMKLSEDRRQKLLAKFKTVTPEEFATKAQKKFSWAIPLVAAAALVMLMSALLLPSLSRAKSRSYSAAIENNLRQIDAAKQQWALENAKAPTDVPTWDELKPFVGRGSGKDDVMGPVLGEEYVIGRVSDMPVAKLDVDKAKRFIRNAAPVVREHGKDELVWSLDRSLVPAPSGSMGIAQNESAAIPSATAAPPPATGTPQIALPDSQPLSLSESAIPEADSENGRRGTLSVRGAVTTGEGVMRLTPASTTWRTELGTNAGAKLNLDSSFSLTQFAGGFVGVGGGGGGAIAGIDPQRRVRLEPRKSEGKGLANSDVMESQPANLPPGDLLDKKSRIPFSGSINSSSSNVYSVSVVGYMGDSPPGLGSGLKDTNRVIPQGVNGAVQELVKRDAVRIPISSTGSKEAEKPQEVDTRDLGIVHPPAPAPVPQPEVQTRENAFSTFSLDVSDVSFRLAAASLQQGRMPDLSSVRSEEFINAFDYRDPEPAAGAPITFAWERAAYPFSHNRDILRFSIKTAAQGRQAGRPVNFVLVLDKSGSMERADRVEIVKQALRILASQLKPQDTLSVIVFARTPHLWLDGLAGDRAGEAVDGLSKLTPEGGTNLEEALKLAYETALRHYLAKGDNRVVLLTDGAANLGSVDSEQLKKQAAANRQQGISTDCFGVGWEGYNDNLLEVLSRTGGGRYGFINSPTEAETGFAAQLAGALRVAAADVKVQVEFNSSRVTAYRQIGYAKDQLAKEQFRDDTVKAAALASAESGNALYALQVNPDGQGDLCTVRVRYRVPGTQTYREQEWTVPYTGKAMLLENATPSLRLATVAAAFSEWLASSPYAAEVTPDRLLGYLKQVPETYGADERPKTLEWMIRQAKSIAGK